MNYETEDVLDGELVDVEPLNLPVMRAMDRAQLDVQIATAKQYPRVLSKCLDNALELATIDADVAATMFYVLPRAGKRIEGPSVRLAEVIAYSWGNIRAESRVISVERAYVVAEGTCFDVERNTGFRVVVKRRITRKNGQRFDDDMIGVTSNAACSIAMRNAVFKCIPQAYVKKIYEASRLASIGKASTMSQTRANLVEWFAKTGIDETLLLTMLKVRSIEDVGTDELIIARGIKTAIKDGETSVESIVRSYKTDSDADVDELAEAIAKKKKAAADADIDSAREEVENIAAEFEASSAQMRLYLKELDAIDNETTLAAWSKLNPTEKIARLMPEHVAIIEARIADLVEKMM